MLFFLYEFWPWLQMLCILWIISANLLTCSSVWKKVTSNQLSTSISCKNISLATKSNSHICNFWLFGKLVVFRFLPVILADGLRPPREVFQGQKGNIILYTAALTGQFEFRQRLCKEIPIMISARLGINRQRCFSQKRSLEPHWMLMQFGISFWVKVSFTNPLSCFWKWVGGMNPQLTSWTHIWIQLCLTFRQKKFHKLRHNTTHYIWTKICFTEDAFSAILHCRALPEF